MKKLLSLLLVLTFVFSLCTVANAEENIKVIIDVTTVKFDVPPTIVNGRTLVPLRAIFEALGATVEWDDATQTVTSEKGDTKISLTINSNIMTVNGEEKELDVPATLIDSRTLVPVRAISESFGLQVGWDGENNLVSILSNTEVFTMLYAKGSRSKVFAKSSAATQAKHGWHEYPVTAVYSADGKETVVASDEVQSYIDSGYYAYPVKTVYAADGSETVIRAEEFNAYIANGYFAEKPVIAVAGGESENSGSIDYSEYEGKTEEELAILTAVAAIKQHYYTPNQTSVNVVHAGYYEGQFLAVINTSTMILGYQVLGDVIVRLEPKSATTFLGQKWNKEGLIFSKPTYPWASELMENKTTHFTRYNSKEFKDAVMAQLGK